MRSFGLAGSDALLEGVSNVENGFELNTTPHVDGVIVQELGESDGKRTETCGARKPVAYQRTWMGAINDGHGRACCERREYMTTVTPNARVQAAAEGGRACNDLLGGMD